MSITLRSFLLGKVAEQLLLKGVDYLEQYTEQKRDELKALVAAKIPGDSFDELAWSGIEYLLPKAFEIARKYIDKLDPETAATAIVVEAAKSE